jgi:site-specific recombinase XerD
VRICRLLEEAAVQAIATGGERIALETLSEESVTASLVSISDRLAQAGITGSYSPHSFRASGLTRFLEEGGTLEGVSSMMSMRSSSCRASTTKAFEIIKIVSGSRSRQSDRY